MGTMRYILAATLACAAIGAFGIAAAAPTPSPTISPLPEIYHTITRPLCSALHTKVAPSIAMMQQNDVTIAKSPKFFQDYVTAQFNQSDPSKTMALLHLENLVTPLVQNVLAIQKLLDDPSVFPDNPQTDDDKRKAELKAQLLQALAAQQGALDIINGFVDTQNMADMQHQGFGYIGAITGTGSTQNGGGPNAAQNGMLGASPDPLHPQVFDTTAINAGLPPNPYEYNLADVPGLALGYNTVSHLKDGVIWTQSEGQKSEQALAKTIFADVNICNGDQPSPSPNP
jgi:hypothetical protein